MAYHDVENVGVDISYNSFSKKWTPFLITSNHAIMALGSRDYDSAEAALYYVQSLTPGEAISVPVTVKGADGVSHRMVFKEAIE